MTFKEVLAQVLEWLQHDQRLSYRAVKRQFALNDDYVEDLKDALLYAYPQVSDDGRGLVWTGDPGTDPAATAAAAVLLAQAPLAYTPSHLAEKILTSRSVLQGERKQVTVLFADLKDSTELIKDLDPEAAQQLLDPAIQRMMDAVHRFEGTVNQVLGDGIMALFGAPIAHEDHALRACYAALAMQAALHTHAEAVRRTHGVTLHMRVGMHCGEVVVRTIGNDLHMDYSAVGQTTHLAARMEQLAPPGSILLSAATLRLVEGLVQVKALGPMPVKGLPEPMEVFELVGASSMQRRLQAAAARGLTRFVGRETELDALWQALVRSDAGHGQVVALMGEAGVGKSRLVHEFTHSHRLQGWLVLESASVSYGKATPYFPVIDLLRRYGHVEDRDDPRTVRARVTGQILTLDEALQDTIPPLLSLLDVLPDDSPFLKLDPPQRRQRTLEALKRLLLRETQVQPLLLVFEDLHWIDAATQALLDSLVESLPTAQLLLLVNYRPEYQHIWGSKTYYTQLRLDPLPPASADEFLQALLGDDPSLVPLKQLLIARTEGNPFFLEESVRTLVETGVLVGAPGAYRLTQALPTIQVPATVQALLAARIDRLPPEEKRLLQTAAVIGTEVPWPLLQAIADTPDEALYRSLAQLQAAEFLYETSLFPERAYTFKHALTHEVAYGSLLQERRRGLHARIVEAIETCSGDRLAEQIDQVAYHALWGAVWDKVALYTHQAGIRAVERAAYAQAGAYFDQALEALAHLPESRETIVQAIELHRARGGTHFALGFPERQLACNELALSLAETLGDPRQLALGVTAVANALNEAGDNVRAFAFAQRGLVLAEEEGDLALLVSTLVRFADQECGAYAPLYDRLARSIARDPELLTIAAHARSGQQAPLLLLAAVHYLLLCGVDHGLAAFYPSVAHIAAVPPGDPVPVFRAFCRDHRDALIDLVSAGLVQTNEPRRCTFLLPAFTTVAHLAGGKPLALIEVGASAGFNLLFDRYGYDYGEGRSAGDPEAPIRFTCELRGQVLPPIPAGMPPVAARVGIDLNPIHAADRPATLWLRALVWPEHPERAALLQQVLVLAQREPPTLIAGDALAVLPQVVAAAPMDAALCVFHTATLAHFPLEARDRLRVLMAELARHRDLFWLSSEGVGLGEQRRQGEYVTILTAFQHGRRAERRLASNHQHGAWLAWLDRDVDV